MRRLGRFGYIMTLTILVPGFSSGQEATPPPQESDPASASFDVLLEQLASQDPAQRIEAVRGLEAHRESSVPYLIRTLRNDPIAEVRGWAARVLHEIGTEAAIAAIRVSLNQDPDERVRSMIGRLLESPPAAGVAAPAEPFAALSPPPTAAPDLSTASIERSQITVEEEAPSEESHRFDVSFVLRLAGWAAWGTLYGASMIVGAVLVAEEVDMGGWWFAPIIGPAVWGTSFAQDNREDSIYPVLVFFAFLCWVDALLQAASLTVAIIGHVRGGESRGDLAVEDHGRPPPDLDGSDELESSTDGEVPVQQETSESYGQARSFQLSFSFVGPRGPGLTMVGVF